MSDDPTTRPNAAQIARELDAIRAAKNEGERWERMLVGLTRVESAVENFHDALDAHKRDDKDFQEEIRTQFGAVTSSVNAQANDGKFTIKQAAIAFWVIIAAIATWCVSIFAGHGKP